MNSPRLVKDISLGSPPSDPKPLLAFRNNLIFVASDGVSGREVWISDGSSTGTRVIKDINREAGWLGTKDDGSYPSHLTIMSNKVYFAANNGVSDTELWVTDGTATGTFLLADIEKSSHRGSDPRYLIAIGNTLFFSAYVSTSGYELWKSDGTAHGTVRISDINIGSSSSDPKYLINMGSTLYFTADDGVSGRELWKSDGTAAGTTLVSDIWPGSTGSDPRYLSVLGNTLFFVANDGQKGRELWKSDGTASGTELVADITWGSTGDGPKELSVFRDSLFFSADNTGSELNRELWRTDGTTPGTALVADIDSTRNGSPVNWFVRASSNPSHLTVVNNLLFFSASSDLLGRELWKTDGTTEGTLLVNDLTPYTLGDPFVFSSSPQNLTRVGNDLYFSARSEGGRELWKTDGTASGTFRIANIGLGFFGRYGSYPSFLTLVNNTLFFSATDNISGFELWALDIDAIVNTGPASFIITGTPVVGNTLTATNSTPDPDGNGTFTYTWQTSTDGSNWSTVGTNSNNYTIARSDQGKQIRLKVDYTDGKGFAERSTTTASQVPSITTLNKREIRQDIHLSPNQSETFTFTLPEGHYSEGRFSVDSYDLYFHVRNADGNLISDSDISISLFDQDNNPKNWESVNAGSEITVRLESKRENNLSDLTLYADILSINGKVYDDFDTRDVFIRNYSADRAVKVSGFPRQFQDTWIISHGWINSPYDPDESVDFKFIELADEIDQQGGEAVLVDWRAPAYYPARGGLLNIEDYILEVENAASWIHDVALFVTHSMVNTWGYKPLDAESSGISLVGHSLGAYLSSLVGQLLKDQPGFFQEPDYLIALDPAEYVGSFYNVSNNNANLKLGGFDANSKSSLALYGEKQKASLGFLGDGAGDGHRAREADYTFNVDFKGGNAFTNHGNIVRLFTNLIDSFPFLEQNDAQHAIRHFFDLRGVQGIQKDNGDDGNFINIEENGRLGQDSVLDEVYLTATPGWRTKKIKWDGTYYLFGKKIQEGYLANGSIFLDFNRSGARELSEPFAEVLSDGSVSFYLSETESSAIDTPGNSFPLIFDPNASSTDLSTGLIFQTSLKAPASASMVTPLTSLVQALIEAGLDRDTAHSTIKQRFNIPSSVDLLSFDPLAQIGHGDINAKDIFRSGVAVQNFVSQLTFLLKPYTSLSKGQLSLKAFDAIASKLSAGAIDLTDPELILELITILKQTASINIPQALILALPDIALVISEGQVRLMQINQDNPYAYLEEIVKIQAVSQGLVSATILAFSSDPTSQTFSAAEFTGDALNQLIANAQIANLLPPTVNPIKFTIAEVPYNQSSPIGPGFVVGSVDAFDPEGQSIAFGLAPDPNHDSFLDIDRDGINAFEISSTGQITVSDPDDLDFEQQPTFHLLVNVDDANFRTVAPVTINLLDLPDGPVPPIVINDGVASFALYGSPAVGNTLEINLLWDDPDAGSTGLNGQWQSSVDGSSWTSLAVNSFSFLVPKEAEGKQIRALVSYTDGQGFLESVATPSALIPSINDGTATFSVTGTPAVGSTLLAFATSADPDGDGEVSYYWQTSSDGENWSFVGTNSSSYLITAADQGKQLRYYTFYFDGQGFLESTMLLVGEVLPMPVITLAVSPASVTEDGAANLTYTFTRSGSTTAEFSVQYSVAGTASLDSDYSGLDATPAIKTVSFAAGASTATVTVDPSADYFRESDETVTLSLAANPAYSIGTSTAVQGTILNDDDYTPGPLTINGVNLGSTPQGYALVSGNAPPLQVTYPGGMASANNPGNSWSAVAASTAPAGSPGYTLYWRHSGSGQTARWELDSSGAYTGGTMLSALQLWTEEASLNLDINGDGATAGPISLNGVNLGSTSQGYALVTGNAPPLQITYPGGVASANNPGNGWSAVAASTAPAASPGYTLFWRHSGSGQTARWELDSSGAYTGGAFLSPAQLRSEEANLNLDLNGDGFNAGPRTIAGVNLGSTSMGYALVSGDAPAIQVTYPGGYASASNPGHGWSALAAAPLGDGYAFFWHHSGSGQAARWDLNSSGAYTDGRLLSASQLIAEEVAFRSDLNGDAIIGSGSTTVENQGNATLLRQADGLAAVQVGGTVYPVSSPFGLGVGDTSSTWQMLAAETVGGQNQILWRNNPGNFLHIWSLNAAWSWQSSDGSINPNSAAAVGLETGFQLDLNGNGLIG
jgi:ELWxxDGT repeat protein